MPSPPKRAPRMTASAARRIVSFLPSATEMVVRVGVG